MAFSYETYPPQEGDRVAIENFIKKSDGWFIPSLSELTVVDAYATKLYDRGFKFVCRKDSQIIGMCVAYVNKYPEYSFGSYTVVDPAFDGNGIGLTVTINAIKYAESFGSKGFRLKTRASNSMLVKFYKKMGFEITEESIFPNTEIKEVELTKIFK